MGAQLSSPDWVYGASGIAGALLLGVEWLTPANPISGTWRLFSQMWGHVSNNPKKMTKAFFCNFLLY